MLASRFSALDAHFKSDPSVLVLESQEFLPQLDEIFWLACDHPSPHVEAFLLRNAILRLSIGYESLLISLCRNYLVGHIATHHFPILLRDLPVSGDRGYILQFFSWSKIAQYPHRWKDNDLVRQLLRLENKNKRFRHAEEGFQIQGNRPGSEFATYINQIKTKRIKVLETLIDAAFI